MVTRADWYRKHADAARKKASECRDQYSKAAYEKLAFDWLRLAEQAEWMASQERRLQQAK